MSNPRGADEAPQTTQGPQEQSWGPDGGGLTREKLKAWLQETGRRWMVLDALDLVDALWPEDIAVLQDLLSRYRDLRRTKPSGRTREEYDPRIQQKVPVTVFKTDVLEVDEMDRVIRFLIEQCSRRDPKWALDGPPR